MGQGHEISRDREAGRWSMKWEFLTGLGGQEWSGGLYLEINLSRYALYRREKEPASLSSLRQWQAWLVVEGRWQAELGCLRLGKQLAWLGGEEDALCEKPASCDSSSSVCLTTY